MSKLQNYNDILNDNEDKKNNWYIWDLIVITIWIIVFRRLIYHLRDWLSGILLWYSLGNNGKIMNISKTHPGPISYDTRNSYIRAQGLF